MRTHLVPGRAGAGGVAVPLLVGVGPECRQRQGERRPGQARRGRHRHVRGRGRQPQDADQDRQERRLPAGRAASGPYKVTASKDGVGSQTLSANVRQGPNNPLTFSLHRLERPVGRRQGSRGCHAGAAGAAMEAMKAGNNDEAITKFNEVIAKVPNCAECYYNIGVAQTRLQKPAEAPRPRSRRRSSSSPTRPTPTPGLANLYNAQKKFDLAAEASANAAKFSGGAAGGAAAPKPATTRA